MSTRSCSLGALLLAASVICIVSQAHTQTQAANGIELIVTVKDTIAISGQQEVRIPVRLSNFFDTIAGFEMWVTTDRPDLISLSRSLDTTGCLTAGWDFIGTEFKGPDSDTVRIIAFANYPYPDPNDPGILPQYGSKPLLNFKVDIRDFHDSLDVQMASIRLPIDDASHFMFSTVDARAIGLETDSVSDTTKFHCDYWEGDTCLVWNQFGGPPWDSIEVVWSTQTVLDTSVVKVVDGSLEVHPAQCGNLSGSDDVINLQDITALISYVYLGGAAPSNLWSANVDGSADGKLNLLDVTYLVASVYLGGPPPACP